MRNLGEKTLFGCLPGQIIGDHLDILIQSLGEAAARSFAQDDPSRLVIGDSRVAAKPFDGDFAVRGTRLVPSGDGRPATVFETATRRPIRLHLPPRYHADRDELGGVDFVLFQWLDDDTAVLVGRGQQDGDVLTCPLSSGRCELAVPLRHGYARLVADTR
jgi:hypothetical protein